MRYLIAAHDAGGAEVVSAWVKANPQHQYTFLLQGPAVTVFTRKIPILNNIGFEELSNHLPRIDQVLTATSWGSDLERLVIQFARSRQIRVAAYLDHWNNYLERFLLNDNLCLPDEIWVGDEDAERLARIIFTETPVLLIKNQYFCEIQSEYEKISKPLPQSDKKNLLYICEPISACNTWKCGNENVLHYTEFTAMQHLFSNLSALDLYEYLNCIKLRLHPSEIMGKYNNLIKNVSPGNGCNIVYSEHTTLLEDYAWADWVVGVSSMALAIAIMLKKLVFTCVPENAVIMRLPVTGILPFNRESIFLTLNSIEHVSRQTNDYVC